MDRACISALRSIAYVILFEMVRDKMVDNTAYVRADVRGLLHVFPHVGYNHMLSFLVFSVGYWPSEDTLSSTGLHGSYFTRSVLNMIDV